MSLDSIADETTGNPAAVLPVGDGPAVADAWTGFGRQLRRAGREHLLLFGVVSLQLVGAALAPALLGQAVAFDPAAYILTVLALAVIAVLAFAIAHALIVRFVVKPADFPAYLLNELFGKVFTGERVARLLPVLLLLPLFAASFSFFKALIPRIRPFDLDPLFAAWDRQVHGGHHPWELLQPILGHPAITALINGGYHLWFGVTYGVILWQMVDTRRPLLRMRYLMTFMLLWILVGNVAAILLSSAGPVYFGRVTGLADPFLPLMAYLQSADAVSGVPALAIQDMLWQWHQAGEIVAGAGISAMPSLHVGIAVSFALIGFSVNRRLGWGFVAFAVLIQVGSVHLGWHYAIDGYVAAACAWLIWLATGAILRRQAVARWLWADAAPAVLAAEPVKSPGR